MWNDKQISIIFPVYNEEKNIENAIIDFSNLTNELGCKIVDEIIVVDNNSTDNSTQLAQKLNAKVVHESKQGYGYALMRGLIETNADIIILCEPDGTFMAKDLIKLLAYSDDCDMVCGTRTTRELIWENANMRWLMRIGNILMAKLLEVLYGTPSLSDCGCTFRLITKQARDKIMPFLHVGKSHFLPNMIIAAKRKQVSFIEIPINYKARIGVSKITGSLKCTIKTATRMFCLIIAEFIPYLISKNKDRRYKKKIYKKLCGSSKKES